MRVDSYLTRSLDLLHDMNNERQWYTFLPDLHFELWSVAYFSLPFDIDLQDTFIINLPM